MLLDPAEIKLMGYSKIKKNQIHTCVSILEIVEDVKQHNDIQLFQKKGTSRMCVCVCWTFLKPDDVVSDE